VIVPEERVVHYLDKTKVPPAIRESLMEKLKELHSPSLYSSSGNVLENIGRHIYRAFIPPTAREALSYLEGKGLQHLEIATNDVEIPWQLMHDGKEFLSLRLAIGRTIQTNASFPLKEPKAAGKINILFISDPREDLPEARLEVPRIIETLDKSVVEVDVLHGEDATIGNVMDTLMNKEEDELEIIHFAGHVDYDSANPHESLMILRDGGVSAKYIHNLIEHPPFLVFMNACDTAQDTNSSYADQQRKITGLASAFITSGCGAYVGTTWPVPDAMAADLAIEFYRNLAAGKSFGIALRDAKRVLYARNPKDASWAAFVLYGDPQLSFPFTKCWFCESRFLVNRTCEKCGFPICANCSKCGCNLEPFTLQLLKTAVAESKTKIS
jgi:CHAT domain-containing protein